MLNTAYAFAIIIAIKIILNLWKFLSVKRYLKLYKSYVEEPRNSFAQHKSQIIRLFQAASIEEPHVSHIEHEGYGHLTSGTVSTFANLMNTDYSVVSFNVFAFNQAIGVFRTRMFESLNPLFWIEAIIMLPKHILSYLGASPESLIIKISQILFWLISTLIGAYWALFPDELRKLIDRVIDTLSR